MKKASAFFMGSPDPPPAAGFALQGRGMSQLSTRPKPQKTAADHGGFFIRNAGDVDGQKSHPRGWLFYLCADAYCAE